MYSLSGYGSMIADRVRLDAYTEALRRTVRPGSVVLEIGAGPGVFSVLACRLGARHVYAIEPAEIIQVAREVAAANGCSDKIEFIENMSTRVDMPEKADVIVSDLRSILPHFQHHIPSIVDARNRFLEPGGVLVPRKDTVWAAIVEAPEIYGGIVDRWQHNALGQDLSTATRLAVNLPQKARVSPEQMLVKPRCWASLDYSIIEDSDCSGTLYWTIERAGTGHGLIAWFDTELVDSVGFSNAPGCSEAIYGSLFFPWPKPVALVEGHPVSVNLTAKLMGDDYVWSWSTKIDARGTEEETSQTPIRFEQSLLGGIVMSPHKLRRAASDFVPELSEDGYLHRRALELIDGKSSLEQIARTLSAEFPKRFSRWQQGLSYAAGLSRIHSR